jgi:hypothetical protein
MIAVTSVACLDAAPLEPESVPHFIGIRIHEDPGVVDQNIKPWIPLLKRFGQLADLSQGPQVAEDVVRIRVAGSRRYLLYHPLGFRRVSCSENNDEAFPREFDGSGLPNAFRCARD